MSHQGRYTVLLGGELTATSRLCEQVAGSGCIAADGGIAHAAKLKLAPELWVGDFDSSSDQLEAEFKHIPRQIHPADKDRTDGEIAVAAALDRGALEIVLAGGIGGQLDHALGNLALLISLARRGIRAFATTGIEEAYPLIQGSLTIHLPHGSRLSIIALTSLEGLDVTGVRWPLHQAAIAQGSTRTLSNVSVGEAPTQPESASAQSGAVCVRLRTGSGFLIAYPRLR